jgi:hypothetical protein
MNRPSMATANPVPIAENSSSRAPPVASIAERISTTEMTIATTARRDAAAAGVIAVDHGATWRPIAAVW